MSMLSAMVFFLYARQTRASCLHKFAFSSLRTMFIAHVSGVHNIHRQLGGICQCPITATNNNKHQRATRQQQTLLVYIISCTYIKFIFASPHTDSQQIELEESGKNIYIALDTYFCCCCFDYNWRWQKIYLQIVSWRVNAKQPWNTQQSERERERKYGFKLLMTDDARIVHIALCLSFHNMLVRVSSVCVAPHAMMILV